MSGVSNNWNMEHEVYHEVTTKEDPLDSPMVIQPFIKASNENDEESGQSSLDDDTSAESNSIGNNIALIYGVEDVPPWHVSFFLGFQVCNHFHSI